MNGQIVAPGKALARLQPPARSKGHRPLHVLKFGGTSVGDASCIARVVDIIRKASLESDVVVVVSAMRGVTNKLVDAAAHAETGNEIAVAEIVQQLRLQHDAALKALVHSPQEQSLINRKMDELFNEGIRLCTGITMLRELPLRARDAISGLGERLSAPLVTAALKQNGIESDAIEATELVVTNSSHGAADPCLQPTRERCNARLLPLLANGIVPVITGFIGATVDGILTTLGRGGSDYSATILGAALEADEIIIWTDVNGLMTADPRLVPDACTTPEVSYREAAELAFFGAKVLHPKTLRPLMQSGIPLRIRNTFEPEKPGTMITPAGAANGSGITALTAISDAALISVSGPGIAEVPDALGRTLAATRELRADLLLVSQASSQNDICLVVPSTLAPRMVEALRSEFAEDLAYEKVEHIALDATVAVVTVVGNMRSTSGIVGRAFAVLSREDVDTLAIAHGASGVNFSFVVAQKDTQKTLLALHREFQLGSTKSQRRLEPTVVRPSHTVHYVDERSTASAD